MTDLTALRELNERRTQGDWSVESGPAGSFGISSVDGWCLCQRAPWELRQDMSSANARLLSLATELYPLAEALNAVVEADRDWARGMKWHYHGYEPMIKAVENARALLDALMAKVRG